jgi:hypothetical protein
MLAINNGRGTLREHPHGGVHSPEASSERVLSPTRRVHQQQLDPGTTLTTGPRPPFGTANQENAGHPKDPS